MPVLRLIRERFARERPLAGMRVAACLHVTTETANLVRTLAAGGAEVALARQQPALDEGRRRRGPHRSLRNRRLRPARGGPRHLLRAPQRDRRHEAPSHDGRRLRPRQPPPSRSHRAHPGHPRRDRGDDDRRHPAPRPWPADGALRFPVVAVNEAETKHLFDNRYGTGQSTLDGILRATNILIAGRRCVVAGYGWVRQGDRRPAQGPRRPRRGRGSQPGPGPRGAHGRVRGEDRGPGGTLGRALHHGHRQRQRLPARALRGHAGRRHHGQQRPLRRGAGPRRPARPRRGPRPRGSRATSRSSTWAPRSCT